MAVSVQIHASAPRGEHVYIVLAANRHAAVTVRLFLFQFSWLNT